jgi:hypothetical protein
MPQSDKSKKNAVSPAFALPQPSKKTLLIKLKARA